jgi:hypothetical protein
VEPDEESVPAVFESKRRRIEEAELQYVKKKSPAAADAVSRVQPSTSQNSLLASCSNFLSRTFSHCHPLRRKSSRRKSSTFILSKRLSVQLRCCLGGDRHTLV